MLFSIIPPLLELYEWVKEREKVRKEMEIVMDISTLLAELLFPIWKAFGPAFFVILKPYSKATTVFTG